MPDLKPCPFCGHKKPKYIEDTLKNNYPVHYIECYYCGARGAPFVINFTPEMVRDAWNKRQIDWKFPDEKI